MWLRACTCTRVVAVTPLRLQVRKTRGTVPLPGNSRYGGTRGKAKAAYESKISRERTFIEKATRGALWSAGKWTLVFLAKGERVARWDSPCGRNTHVHLRNRPEITSGTRVGQHPVARYVRKPLSLPLSGAASQPSFSVAMGASRFSV